MLGAQELGDTGAERPIGPRNRSITGAQMQRRRLGPQ